MSTVSLRFRVKITKYSVSVFYLSRVIGFVIAQTFAFLRGGITKSGTIHCIIPDRLWIVAVFVPQVKNVYGVLLYSLGLIPKCFLNREEKWERVLNPVRSATSEMVCLPSLISCAARFNLYNLKKLLGVSPVSPLIL